MLVKRCFDIILSIIGLVVLFPALLIIAILTLFDSKTPVFFLQSRVGYHNKDFKIFKFRTMEKGSENKGLLTLGDNDPRVTKIGYFLRKYKLDELPQLANVLIGDMSFVGPRPEVRKYVDMFPKEYSIILSTKPGITDLASVAFRNEAELLKHAVNAEEYYTQVILPKKLNLHKKYIANRNLIFDIKIILKTFLAIIK